MADVSADIPTAITNALPAAPNQTYFNNNFAAVGADNSTPPQSWVTSVYIAISTPTVPNTTPPVVIQGGVADGGNSFNTGMN